MKKINDSAFTLVRAGQELRVPEPIDWKGVTQRIERCEECVYWMQPTSGAIDDQFACVYVNGHFYSMTNRMEKAVFRNVRLSRNFANFERLADGTRKLRLPLRLLREKIRASSKTMPRRSSQVAAKKQAVATSVASTYLAVLEEFDKERALHLPLPDLRTSPEKLLEQMWRVYNAEYPRAKERAEFVAAVTAEAPPA